MNLNRLISSALSSLQKEVSVLKTLHKDAKAALKQMEAKDPGLRQFLKAARGYAVFPAIGKGAAVVGGAFGKGEVFERGQLVGYAGAAQVTLGVQLGGEAVAEIIAFETGAALDRFKKGRFALAANASAVVVKAGAAASADYERGVAVFVHSQGGLMVEAAVGGQKFFFRPAFLGRTKRAHEGAGEAAGIKAKTKPETKPPRKPPTKPRAKTKRTSTRIRTGDQAAQAGRRTPAKRPGRSSRRVQERA